MFLKRKRRFELTITDGVLDFSGSLNDNEARALIATMLLSSERVNKGFIDGFISFWNERVVSEPPHPTKLYTEGDIAKYEMTIDSLRSALKHMEAKA